MPGGWLVASLEEWRPETSAAKEGRIGYHLHAAGRYSHHRSYVLELLHACGFMVRHVEALDIRSELARPVPGLLIAAQRTR
jgi:predicted TPR repeat methyltransferase